MIMFFRSGYLAKHPQCFMISTNIPAFLFICLVSLLIIPLTDAAACEDGECYKGYDKVSFILNLSDNHMEGELRTEETSDYTLNEITFLITVTSVDRTNIKANIQINTSDINATNVQKTLAVGENFSFNGLRMEIQNITTGFENEEIICPQDCFEGVFVRLDEIFELGTGVCKNKYKFMSANNDQNYITIKNEKEDEGSNLNYNINVSDKFGNPLIFETKIYEKDFIFNMDYNENTTLLHIGNANQTCPIVEGCASNPDCDDNDACTIDECDGDPLKCKYKHIVWCRNDDDCCPLKCDYNADNDCKAPDKCTSDIECNDNNNCTVDLCTGDPKDCVNQPIINFTSGDSCCPVGGNNTIDTDCPKIIVCGDQKCEEHETKENCCLDCGCDVDYNCLNNTCAKSDKLIVEETIDGNEEFISRQNELLLKDFVFTDKVLLASEGGFDFEYIYLKEDKVATLKGSVANGQVMLLAPEKSGFSNMLILLVIILPIVFGGLVVVSGVKKRKKEEKFKQLLQQRYGQRQPMGHQLPGHAYSQHYAHPGQHPQRPIHHPGYPQQQRPPSYPQQPPAQPGQYPQRQAPQQPRQTQQQIQSPYPQQQPQQGQHPQTSAQHQNLYYHPHYPAHQNVNYQQKQPLRK